MQCRAQLEEDLSVNSLRYAGLILQRDCVAVLQSTV